MKPDIEPGRYILAVSGGVDSMVLLDLLADIPGLELIVAHFNHGTRPDSGQDEKLVAKRAKQLGKRYEAGYGHLGKGASEAAARTARYHFLENLREKYSASGIITAHHQDDLIETAVLNTLRGTGPKGLSAIAANEKVLRPLLGCGKREILNYARRHNLQWREDPTNYDDHYLRNYIRHRWLSGLTAAQKRKLISNIDIVAKNNSAIDAQIAKLSRDIYQDAVVDRPKFASLPVDVENELLAYWLRGLGVAEFDRKTINRVNLIIRTSKPGTEHPVIRDLKVEIKKHTARFTHSL